MDTDCFSIAPDSDNTNDAHEFGAAELVGTMDRVVYLCATIELNGDDYCLARCLALVKPFVDQITIVGPCQAAFTRQIAAEYGATISTEAADSSRWVDWRNVSTWNLRLLANEYAPDLETGRLLELIADLPSDALGVRFEIDAAEHKESASPQIRLTRHHPAISSALVTDSAMIEAIQATGGQVITARLAICAFKTRESRLRLANEEYALPCSEQHTEQQASGLLGDDGGSVRHAAQSSSPASSTMVVDVVILSFAKSAREYEMTSRCLRTLHASESEITFNVVVVETNSAAAVRSFASDDLFGAPCRVIFPSVDFNYNLYLQAGYEAFSKESSPYLLICNNDVLFETGFCSTLLRSLQRFDSVSPWCPGYHERLLDRTVPEHVGYRTSYELCGWALLMKKELFDHMDFADWFPAKFPFWFQDNYYAHRLRRAGCHHALITAAKVHHLFQQSHDLIEPVKRESLTRGAQQHFEEFIAREEYGESPLLTIAILSLPARARSCLPLLIERLDAQSEGLAVEILCLLDNKRRSIGQKRNDLISLAQGRYVAFIDDDDQIADDYVANLVREIHRHPEVDCITFHALVTIDGGRAKLCRYELGAENVDLADCYLRSPNHICCLRTDLARQVPFLDLNWQEDSRWAQDIRGLLKTEHHIERVLYHYRFDTQASQALPFRNRPEPIPSPSNGHAEDRRERPYRSRGVSSHQTDRPVYGFMHVAAMGNWQEVFREQTFKIHASGLYDRAARIFVEVHGAQRNGLVLPGAKFELSAEHGDAKQAEFPTLSRLHEFCKTHEAMVFYVHTKGVSRPAAERERMLDWRRLMEHFVILGYRDCLESLAEYDVCGVNWRTYPHPHFSGNFWWANSGYISGLPLLSDLVEEQTALDRSRHLCEKWLGMDASVRAACLHESGIDHYHHRYPRSRYSKIREVECDDAWWPESAWAGLENRFQDLLEPVHSITRVVEIGVEYGFSLFSLAAALPNAEVMGIDPYDSITKARRLELGKLGTQAVQGSAASRDWVSRHLLRFPNARLLIMTSEAARVQTPELLDVVHVDAVHTYAAVAKDFWLWEPTLRPGGCMLFHGTVAFRGDVGRFFRELPGRKAEIQEHNGLGAWYKPGR